MAIFDDARERAQHVGLVAEIHRAVRPLPVTEHAQPLEVVALGVDLLGRVLAAFLSECSGVELVARLAELFLHRDLDRQAVTIPARHVRRAMTRQQLRLDRDVFENLVHRVADMDRAVRIRRTVVQHEHLFAPGRQQLDLCIAIDPFPLRQPVRLALGQVAAHRKIRLRQVDRALVIVGHCLNAIAKLLSPANGG